MPVAVIEAARAALTRPGARQRLAEIVEATVLEGLYGNVLD